MSALSRRLLYTFGTRFAVSANNADEWLSTGMPANWGEGFAFPDTHIAEFLGEYPGRLIIRRQPAAAAAGRVRARAAASPRGRCSRG